MSNIHREAANGLATHYIIGDGIRSPTQRKGAGLPPAPLIGEANAFIRRGDLRERDLGTTTVIHCIMRMENPAKLEESKREVDHPTKGTEGSFGGIEKTGRELMGQISIKLPDFKTEDGTVLTDLEIIVRRN